MDDEETPPITLDCTNIHSPVPLKGYEYTTFNPTPINWNSPGTAAYQPHPTQPDVLVAMEDLKKILHPRCNTGRGYKDPEIDLWHHAWMEGMMSMFHMFTNPQSCTSTSGVPLHAKQQLGWAEGITVLGSSTS